jgi:hypothetical protein
MTSRCWGIFTPSLSERSVWYRYFSQHSLERRMAHRRLAWVCFVDYDRVIALVAAHSDPETPERGGSSGSRGCAGNKVNPRAILPS